MRPTEVTKDIEHELRMIYTKNEQTSTRSKMEVGDGVRITVKKDMFSNNYWRN